MASPSENVSTLVRYWQEALNVSAWEKQMIGASQWPARLYIAERAMIDLLAASDEHVRRGVFAAGSVFETCLTLEPAGVTDLVLSTPLGRSAHAPRQIMLDRLYTITTGGWWAPPSPAGITEWVRSESVSAAAIASVITGDPKSSVRAAACKLVQDVAIPRFWAEFLGQQRTFVALEEQIKTSSWSLAERVTLNALASGAGARVQAELARYAMEALPTFPTGDGSPTATLPPRGKPPWRDARVISATILGLITGGAVASKRSA